MQTQHPHASRITLGILLISLAGVAIAAATVPEYVPSRQPISGSLSITGSATQAYIAAGWGVEMKRLYPGLKYEMSMSGSSTAPPALIDGSTDLGFMSRRMKDKEIADFEKKFGYKPTELKVALDAVTVYVHKDNPVKGLTLAQVDAIFSTTRKCGGSNDITTWDQAGSSGALRDSPIKLIGRTRESGTRELFADKFLCRGEFKSGVQPHHTVVAVLSAVASNRNAIAYSGAARSVSGIRMVPIALKAGDPFVEPTEQNIASGKYPMTRYLYIYVNKAPGQSLPPAVREFLRFALSARGQEIVDNDGFVPLDATTSQQELSGL